MTDKSSIKITIMSFGYKYGMAEDASFVQDVRFLPNPYYDEALKSKTGLSEDVRDYVKKTPESRDYISRLKSYTDFYIKNCIMADKENIRVAIGCTGGRHRSVTVAIELYEYLKEKGYDANIVHRDIEKD
ncbi:MAG: hypothetical protein IJN40_06075 [Clostridia bacterium]|nr:hypothetical protein [Clostridia bacterium]